MSLLGKLFGRFSHTKRGLKADRSRKSKQPWERYYRKNRKKILAKAKAKRRRARR